MKSFGKDIKEFWLNHWPLNMYVEDEDESLFDEKGAPKLEDGEKYDLSSFGYLLREEGATAKEGPFSTHFSAWLKRRDTVSIIVTVKRDDVDQAMSAIEKIGLKASVGK